MANIVKIFAHFIINSISIAMPSHIIRYLIVYVVFFVKSYPFYPELLVIFALKAMQKKKISKMLPKS